jgi:hypothetical protein
MRSFASFRPMGPATELLDARLEHVGTMSRDDAVIARKDVLDAIERLLTFEKLLTRKIDAAS